MNFCQNYAIHLWSIRKSGTILLQEIILCSPPLMNDRVGSSLVHKKSMLSNVYTYGSCQNHADGSKLNCVAFGHIHTAFQIKLIYPLGALIKHTTKSVIIVLNFVLNDASNEPPFNCQLSRLVFLNLFEKSASKISFK